MIAFDCFCADDFSVSTENQLIRFPQTDDELYPLDDKKATRAMNRMTILILKCLYRQYDQLLRAGQTNLGIYALCDIGPTPEKIFTILMQNQDQDFAAFRAAWPPKQLFKKDGGLISAQVSIFLNSVGPAFSLNNSDECFRQALNLAQNDLESEWIDHALIVGGFSPEDPTLLYKASSRSKVVSEASGFLLIDKTDCQISVPEKSSHQYGHCSHLISTIKSLQAQNGKGKGA